MRWPPPPFAVVAAAIMDVLSPSQITINKIIARGAFRVFLDLLKKMGLIISINPG